MLNYVRELLETDQYRVETAVGGLRALELVRSGLSPDVVLLDVNMPEMDGLETLTQLLELQPRLKVVMCSGTPNPRKALSALLMGAHDFLTKPFRHLYLSAAIERCLADRKGNEPVRWSVVQDIWETAT